MSGSTTSKDASWAVAMTELNSALASGLTLQARKLLANGHAPDADTTQLVRKQDRLASHYLSRQAWLDPGFLPGSDFPQNLQRLEAMELADKMAAKSLNETLPPGRERERQRF